MPLDREVEFLAVDEIQMCADPERGHVFTDRLLRARGAEKHCFSARIRSGWSSRDLCPMPISSTARACRNLPMWAPEKSPACRAEALPVASINEVYAIAELMRRQRGTAVVLGALSPRTRNAQVEMYQGGDVDYLVATDAIGMGLNMNIDHVAFAGTRNSTVAITVNCGHPKLRRSPVVLGGTCRTGRSVPSPKSARSTMTS